MTFVYIPFVVTARSTYSTQEQLKTRQKMFKNTFQSGFLSILYSIGSKPLQIWDKKVRNGHIKRITDNDIQSLVLEIVGTNVSTTFITCPADPKKTLGIKLPFLVMIIKNLKKYFTFEVQVCRSGLLNFIVEKKKTPIKQTAWLPRWRIYWNILCCPRFWMTKMFAEDFVPATISQRHEWNRSFVQCQWDWMRVGIKFNLIYRILHDEHTGRTMWKHCVYKFMQIVAFDGFTFPIDCIRRKSYRVNLNYFYQYRNQHKKH